MIIPNWTILLVSIMVFIQLIDCKHSEGNRPGRAGKKPGSHGKKPGSHGKKPGSHGKRPGSHKGPGSHGKGPGSAGERPNIVFLVADDLGYGDLSCYGHSSQEYGPIDQLAAEGIRFTQFYSADSLCTPARAGFMTGRLAQRLGIHSDLRVFSMMDYHGLPQDELTIAELLKDLGYKTGMVGKWHLGINAVNRTDGTHLPSKHGFDYVGKIIPFSIVWDCDTSGIFRKEGPDSMKCFMYDGDTIYQQPINLEKMTELMVEDYNHFMDQQNPDEPFFFFFSFPHVHNSLWAAPEFKGNSKRGLYGDNTNEMAWGVKEVMKTLKDTGFDDNTLVLFISDHGPHIEVCTTGGVGAGLRGGKSNSFEGGFRVPTIARWPGVIAPGQVSSEVLSALDILPTFVSVAGGELPTDRVYDGFSFDHILTDPNGKSDPKRPIFFYCSLKLMALRFGPYKIHYITQDLFPANSSVSSLYCPSGLPIKDFFVDPICDDEKVTIQDPPLVFNVHRDPYEQYPLVDDEELAGVMADAKEIVSKHKATLEPVESILGARSFSLLPCCNYPDCQCNYP